MSAGPTREGSIDAEQAYRAGSGVGSRVSSLFIQFEDQSFSGSVTIKGRASGTSRPLIGLGYKDNETNATATAAITTNASVLVDATGQDIYLDCTSRSAGALEFTAIPVVG